MATQQVKFHSVSEEQYKAIGTPNEGGLYFITDNGEIRKGSHHVTGTRVYTAVDSTNGATPIKDLTILLNGNAPGANDQPKKGDILIVDQTLKAASSPDAGDAIIAKAAYAHNGTDWEACDGNVDASKVILTQDIMLAGNYDKVGNLNKGSASGTKNFETTGKSVYDALVEMLSQDQQPGNPTNPSMKLDGSNETVEIGTTYQAKPYTATWMDGSYTYGAWVSDGNTQTATGAKVGTWTVTAYGKTNADAVLSGNTANITPAPYVVADVGIAHELVKF